MGKLVLLLADGRRAEVRLDRERITIGRRADNDVCVSHASVSNEHATIVTVLSDSFVEDMRSTNGTLVNRTPVTTRQLLRDGDEIEIGRQRFVYLADDNAVLPPAATSEVPRPSRRESDRAASSPSRRVSPSAATAPGRDERQLASPPWPVSAPIPDDASPASIRAIDRFVAAEIAAARDVDAGDEAAAAPAAPVVPSTMAEAPAVTPLAESASAPRGRTTAVMRVRTGPGAGRSVALVDETTSIGRIGVQVASIRRNGSGFHIVGIEGERPPLVNGVPLPATGMPLCAGDVVEIAGARVEFDAPADPS